jgi:RNA polymerase sigma factor (sigma-70 family)
MRTARRFSLNEGDAEDVYQRALEIVLTKAPTTDPEELIRWTQTVTKHEALAVRRSRERLLGQQPRETAEGGLLDPLALIPASGDGPAEQVERREDIARSREALRRLKPAELRALALLAEGYSYVEIGEMTGYSQTKVNRVLAEGRSRFRDMVSRSEDGRRCRELRPILSAFCDGEAGPGDAETIRDHLRACAHCRATMRAYRSAPGLAGALVPTLLLPTRSLLGRLQALLARGGAQMPGPAKLATVCAVGAIGGVATGVVPLPRGSRPPASEPPIERLVDEPRTAPQAAEPNPPSRRSLQRRRHHRLSRPVVAEADHSAAEAEAPSEPIEYESPPPEPVETATSAGATESSGSAAGEFGP